MLLTNEVLTHRLFVRVEPPLCQNGALVRVKMQLVTVELGLLDTLPFSTVQWSMVRPPVPNSLIGWCVALPPNVKMQRVTTAVPS